MTIKRNCGYLDKFVEFNERHRTFVLRTINKGRNVGTAHAASTFKYFYTYSLNSSLW